MGNRAVITTSLHDEGFGIYLHWNGGAESVVAFLDAARERQYRDPVADPERSMARLCGLLHEFFGAAESASLAIGLLKELDCDNDDNGVYVVGADWEVVDRWGAGSSPLTVRDVMDIRASDKYKAIVNQLRLNVEDLA